MPLQSLTATAGYLADHSLLFCLHSKHVSWAPGNNCIRPRRRPFALCGCVDISLVGARFFDWSSVSTFHKTRNIQATLTIINDSNNMTSSIVMKSIVILVRLIESKDWENFEERALSNPTIFGSLCEEIPGCE